MMAISMCDSVVKRCSLTMLLLLQCVISLFGTGFARTKTNQLTESEVSEIQGGIALNYFRRHEELSRQIRENRTEGTLQRAECARVIIHTMGKTGSAGFSCSLNEGIPVLTAANILPPNERYERVVHIHDHDVVGDVISRIQRKSLVKHIQPKCVVILLARNPYQRWISQYWQNILEYHPTCYVQSVDVKVLHEAYVDRIRQHAYHSQYWLARAYIALHGDQWEKRVEQTRIGRDGLIRKGRPLAWAPLKPHETYRFVPAGDGLACATLMLKYEHRPEWETIVNELTQCPLTPKCMQFGREIVPNLAEEKWYAAKKREFQRTFTYPDDLVSAFRSGPMRRFFQYDEYPPSDL
eukprot:m.83220 g.83220  ORF g.83220 m.83220 type:complete len:352 (+) comp25607_c0_seq1:116-1171(+)